MGFHGPGPERYTQPLSIFAKEAVPKPSLWTSCLPNPPNTALKTTRRLLRPSLILAVWPWRPSSALKAETYSSWPTAVPRPGFTVIGLEDHLNSEASPIRKFTKASIPIEELARQATVLCNVSLSPDPDGIFRKVDLLNVFDDQWVPSLGLGLFLAANPETHVGVYSAPFAGGRTKYPH